MDSMAKDLKKLKVTNWKRIAEDRKRWRRIVAQLWSTTGCDAKRRRRKTVCEQNLKNKIIRLNLQYV